MNVKMYGVRGLMPAPGKATARYGGNTSCVALTFPASDKIIIFDAGTGIRQLGQHLAQARQAYQIHLFISHTHADHIQGFPFFIPLFMKDTDIKVYGPRLLDGNVLDILRDQMRPSHFPAGLGSIKARLQFQELAEETVQIGSIVVKTMKMNHPIACLGYRVQFGDHVVTYASDHEPYYEQGGSGVDIEKLNENYREFIARSDILIADAQYLPEEYERHRGWGHGTTTYVVNQASQARVKRLVLTHHDPNRTDDQIDQIIHHYKGLLTDKRATLELIPGQEGLELQV